MRLAATLAILDIALPPTSRLIHRSLIPPHPAQTYPLCINFDNGAAGVPARPPQLYIPSTTTLYNDPSFRSSNDFAHRPLPPSLSPNQFARRRSHRSITRPSPRRRRRQNAP